MIETLRFDPTIYISEMHTLSDVAKFHVLKIYHHIPVITNKYFDRASD